MSPVVVIDQKYYEGECGEKKGKAIAERIYKRAYAYAEKKRLQVEVILDRGDPTQNRLMIWIANDNHPNEDGIYLEKYIDGHFAEWALGFFPDVKKMTRHQVAAELEFRISHPDQFDPSYHHHRRSLWPTVRYKDDPAVVHERIMNTVRSKVLLARLKNLEEQEKHQTAGIEIAG